ncbi:MAG: hypothetical protein ACPLXS_00565 [Candidatus Micrarchaeales archaeon]
MFKKYLLLLFFGLLIAFEFPMQGFKIGNLSLQISRNNSVLVTFPNGSKKEIPQNLTIAIIRNFTKNSNISTITHLIFLNITNQNIQINKEMEKIKEIYKHYGGNEAKIEEEYIKELSNISLPTNVSIEKLEEEFKEKQKEVWGRVERKFINHSSNEYWKKHRICVAIYPNLKECPPEVFPIFINQTKKLMLPNGSIISVNETIFVRGLGKIIPKEDEVEIENESTHSFIKEVHNRPVVVTITKTPTGVNVIVTNLISGVRNEIEVEKEENVFKHIVVHTKGNVSNVIVNITRIKNITFPPKVPKEFSKALFYEINSNLSDSDIKNVTFTVVVNQTWLNKVNSSIGKIGVIRINGNTSQVLQILNVTTQKIGNETFYYLKVVSPGFSLYVVTPLITPTSSIFNINSLIIAGIVFLIIAIVTIVLLKRRKKSK